MKRSENIYKSVLRDNRHSDRIKTRICLEESSNENPYVTENRYIHGYNVLDLMVERSFSDVLFLHVRGELPTRLEARLLEMLIIGLSNPGIRHPAVRASINVGVGKTDVAHILPISLAVLSGAYLGASEVEASMKFIKLNVGKEPKLVVDSLMRNSNKPDQGDWHIAPGFGSRYGSVDIITQKIAKEIISGVDYGDALRWCGKFVTHLLEYNLGWLSTGLASAVFIDLGIHPRSGPGLYQIMSSPGLLAHGLEYANKPITDLPFIDDEHYIIEK